MIGADKGKAPSMDGRGLKIGLVQARFNEGITNALATACLDELTRLGVQAEDIETYHFELVANESAAGVTRVGLDYRLPIANVILTTENLAQAQARQSDKGVDAAQVVIQMCKLIEQIGQIG
jgi:6,7-dimethyl-8-ribityllumazine synthase